nr:MAG TPA: hypothetical protein [Caudoviricetes sp.]DAQ34902.1 MAG TPA: hypothetical protein [Caudoviricetes sp.]DAQ41392.1 MAG TPA: hypothetical protein [Caudoviricetes sp.]
MKSPKLLTCVRCTVGVLNEVNCTFIGNLILEILRSYFV